MTTIMHINPGYLEISFENAGVRNSQKRLRSLIETLAIEPLKEHQEDLLNRFSMVEEIVMKRIAAVIIHWCQYKHDPVQPESKDMMSEITNASKNDVTLEAFFISEVKSAMYTLAPTFGLVIPDDYEPRTDELEYALIELEDRFAADGGDVAVQTQYAQYDDDWDDADEMDDFDFTAIPDADEVDSLHQLTDMSIDDGMAVLAELVAEETPEQTMNKTPQAAHQERAIVSAQQQDVIEVNQAVQVDVLDLTVEQTWNLIYGLIGYESDYIQQSMLPRWQQTPETFERDRRFLYKSFIETIQKYSGAAYISGNFRFVDREDLTVDALWNHYFVDLSQRVVPVLAAARLETAVNDPWYKKLFQQFRENMGNISPIWMLALVIALIFDGLTTYVSLEQTPMEGVIVLIFTVLITALFQIADQLVINYRKREFEAEAMSAKYQAQFERISTSLEGLPITSDSYVKMSMDRSRAQADWKAAEDNRKMARRGRFWSARIADINVIVTAYGFSFMFLNSEEPLYALAQQIDYIFIQGDWQNVNLWVFLMIGLAITVSFVVNTAQRTEILGWSMRRLKQEA